MARSLLAAYYAAISLACAVRATRVMESFMVPLRNVFAKSISWDAPAVEFSPLWQVLGPFQIGTREGPWGADPLEYFGGFRALEFNESATFKSSLPANASARWSTLDATNVESNEAGANASLALAFSNVDWQFLQAVYGWSALQYQSWARGEIIVNGDAIQTVVLYTDWILEFWVDGKLYFGGDFYSYRKAPPVLHLSPGTHRLDLRMWRDVRSFGGITEGDPQITADIALQICKGSLEVTQERIKIPDVIDGRFSSEYGSVAVRNTGLDTVRILGVRPQNSSDWEVAPDNISQLEVVSGQTRPISFRLALKDPTISELRLEILYTYDGAESNLSAPGVQPVVKKSTYDPHKFTFKHPGGIVSYAMLRPPAKNATCGLQGSAPVLLGLHGAGLEADVDGVARAFDPLPDLCAWVLFPTGVTPWSADDWHAWGFPDVEAAVAAIPEWIKHNAWNGTTVDTDRWLVSGHSNGGQGTWYAITHRPDKIIAAVPISGYSSIERYVPYEFWSPTIDPGRQSVLRSALNTYRHESLFENCESIPILQSHGGADTNVPTFHSRLMNFLLSLRGSNAGYYEIPGSEHFFDGIMTTEPLRTFYRTHIPNGLAVTKSLKKFTIVVGTPGDMGSKGGITVTQLETPGRYGRMEVSIDPRDEETCIYSIQTKNILSFSISPHECQSATVIVRRQNMASSATTLAVDSGSTLTWTNDIWMQTDSDLQTARRGKQLGAIDAILRSNGTFSIAGYGVGTDELALQISRNLYTYFSADSTISGSAGPGNSITVAVGTELPARQDDQFPIQVTDSGLLLVRAPSGEEYLFGEEEDVAAIYLRPGTTGQESLELVVWGGTARTAAIAARLVPTLTGVSQPDFVVLAGSSSWKGAEGAVAMGFFDERWNIASTSFFA
ncbi:alpha beta protein [Diplodia corticola]|uniref:Alpha beta protein n=1 Tax=Diplodia corticola TaxID=236234 RepID=A0A1J9QVC0_9PEZI|nr:alpha beta protein [Diplodia corticola]OJD31938.1 alpha beta protein [Diplodia corticola]